MGTHECRIHTETSPNCYCANTANKHHAARIMLYSSSDTIACNSSQMVNPMQNSGCCWPAMMSSHARQAYPQRPGGPFILLRPLLLLLLCLLPLVPVAQIHRHQCDHANDQPQSDQLLVIEV